MGKLIYKYYQDGEKDIFEIAALFGVDYHYVIDAVYDYMLSKLERNF